MYLVYIDDSRDARLCVFSGLMIPEMRWHAHLKTIKDFRLRLRETDGIFLSKEFHATDFVSGRGRLAQKDVTKWRRSRIFLETLHLAAGLEGVRIINVCLPNNHEAEAKAFERLLNRVNRAMKVLDSNAILLCDEGKNAQYTRIRRKMAVYNPIPSQYGAWQNGAPTMNIPLDRVIEDPVFLDSSKAYFIQLVDFCAFALLRRENPIASRTKYGIDQGFAALTPILHLPASANDPEGIVRR